MPQSRVRRPERDGSELLRLQVVYFYVRDINSPQGIGQVFIAKQKYDAIGNRSNRVLSFEKGEELEVLAPNPGSEWWEVSVTL